MNLDGNPLKELAEKEGNTLACGLDTETKEALIYINPEADVGNVLSALLEFYKEYLKLRSDNGNTKEEV